MKGNNTEIGQVLETSDIHYPWPLINTSPEPAATSWWLTDTGIALLGIAVDLLVIAIVATMVLLFARCLIAEAQKTANSLSAIVRHLEERKAPARADLAAAVRDQMNSEYYQDLIAAVEHAMLRNGFKFGQDAANEVILPLDVLRDVCRDLTKAQTQYMHPLDKDIDARIRQDEKTGYSEKFVRGIIAAMREQGQYVERSFEIISR